MATDFYSDNDSDSLADALKAVGLAQAYRAWLIQLGRASTPIKIVDYGQYHLITLPAALDETDIERTPGPFAVGVMQPLVSASQQKAAEKAGRTLDGFLYDDYKAKREVYYKQYLALTPAERAKLEQSPEFDTIRRLAPPAEYPLYAYINQFKIAGGYNALVAQWQDENPAMFRENLRFLLRAFSQTPNPFDEAIKEWETRTGVKRDDGSATRLQIINPTTGKGANASKGGTLSIGGLEGFWLIEYLKFVGLFTLAAPLVVKGSKDRKTYVLRPVQVELAALDSVMAEFRTRVTGNTAVKVDVLTALRFTASLVEYLRHAMTSGQPDPLLEMLGERRRLTNIARGFDVAFYKDMGSAFATMNLATVNLPDWLPPDALNTPEQANAALALLTEHQRVVQGIRTSKGDEGSEEYELLRRYRDFFSGRDIGNFLDFTALYGDYLLAKIHRNQWAGQFTTDGLDTLIKTMELDRLMTQKTPPFTPIIESEGFRAIATAIRRATVSAQYAAARQRTYPYEVRYGLGQELLRAAAYPQDFLAALGAFIQSYNAENARIDERNAKRVGTDQSQQPRRASVRVEHLDEIVRLVDQYRDSGGSELICKLLLAYGYARDPRAPGEQGATPDQEPTQVGDDDANALGDDA